MFWNYKTLICLYVFNSWLCFLFKQNIDPHATSKMLQFWDDSPDHSDTGGSHLPVNSWNIAFSSPPLCSPSSVSPFSLTSSFPAHSPFNHTETLALSKVRCVFFIPPCFFKHWVLGKEMSFTPSSWPTILSLSDQFKCSFLPSFNKHLMSFYKDCCPELMARG